MIWVHGKVVPDDALRISVFGRTFEHGQGLFETFRTWNGHPTLLPRHMHRMERSARALGLPLDSGQLPDAPAVARLIASKRASLAAVQAARLRVPSAGGQAPTALPPRLVCMTTTTAR